MDDRQGRSVERREEERGRESEELTATETGKGSWVK